MSGCSHANTMQNLVGIKNERPELLDNIPPFKMVILDVRPLAASGERPCGVINKAIDELKDGEVLQIINSFQPGSLYGRLEKLGYSHWTECEGNDWYIWFYKT